jgi:cytochrome o ubiquinol oxidase subunit II
MRRALFTVVLISTMVLGGCAGGVLDPKGPIAFNERQILFDATGIMLAIVIPVMLATLGVAFWFRASNERAVYQPNFKESGRIEILIWSIPLMTILLVGTVAWISSYELDPPKPLVSPMKPVKVQVASLDWKWLFIYPEEGVASINRLVIPVGTPVTLELTSTGVMNSFFVPQLAGQIYTMAGMVTHLNLQADYSGTYHGISANFSGDGFSDMHFNVDAVPPEKFADWVTSTRSAGPVLDGQAFTDLVKPSTALEPFTYRSIAPGLFADILSTSSESSEGLCVRYPGSVRAEQ